MQVFIKMVNLASRGEWTFLQEAHRIITLTVIMGFSVLVS